MARMQRGCDLCGQRGPLIKGVCRRCLASTLEKLPPPSTARRGRADDRMDRVRIGAGSRYGPQRRVVRVGGDPDGAEGLMTDAPDLAKHDPEWWLSGVEGCAAAAPRAARQAGQRWTTPWMPPTK